MSEDATDELLEIARLSRAMSLQYFKNMDKALSADTNRFMEECLKLKGEKDSQGPLTPQEYAKLGFWYRGLARALLIYVEGLLLVMRQLVIYAEERGEVNLSAGENALVREVSYSLNGPSGKVEERKKYNSFSEKFILSCRFFPQVLGSSFEVDYSVHGWEMMKRLVRHRNDLTHPKQFQSTILEPELANVIRDASTWFFGCMRDLVASADTVLLDQSFKETAKMPEMQRLLAKRDLQRAS